ncbi:MAG: hypothetical protein AAGA58_00075 [Verrucomicrobiota bacterium]
MRGDLDAVEGGRDAGGAWREEELVGLLGRATGTAGRGAERGGVEPW